jgi:hypothetical protein
MNELILPCSANGFKAPVDYQDFPTDADEWAHMVADNRLAALAEADSEALKEVLGELKAGDFDLDLAGFDANALAELLMCRMCLSHQAQELKARAGVPNLVFEDPPVPIFRGLALSASVQGKKETVRCASAMDSMRANVPAMMLQPRCNYRLYEPNTCRVDSDLHKLAVTLASASGRK